MATPTAKRSTLVAVDTNFLLDLATPKDKAADTIEIFRARVPGVEFVVLPTVLDELAHIEQHGDTAEDRELAATAMRNLVRVWRFRPLDFISVGHGIIEEIAKKLRADRLIPAEEVNDSFIVAEAALADCAILITSDEHIRGMDMTTLALALRACDVNVVVVRTPAGIARQFGGKR
ncbi:MAG TPA: type II toxin-antitoxin system VapC family toxin [Opitutaceae bacterium]|jgi:rRNA-processing protein FCF1